MLLTHGALAVVTIFLVTLATHMLINEHFLNYIHELQSEEHLKIVKEFTEFYREGKWNREQISKSGQEMLAKGYLITLTDSQGQTLWSPQQIDPQTYRQTLEQIQARAGVYFKTVKPSLITKEYPLKSPDNLSIGKLTISYYDTYFLNEHDILFLNSLNKSLLVIAGISFLMVLLFSTRISETMGRQLGAIVEAAKEIASRRQSFRDKLIDTKISEIKELAYAIKQLEEDLREQEESNKRLTADIAHELRTPLATLQSHLEALIEGIWEPTRERLISCHEEILRMTSLVNDLEKLNKYDTGQIELNKVKFDLSSLVNNIITNFQRDFCKKKIALTFSGQPCEIIADREKIGQVVVNLLTNSLKYTPEGGEVFINVFQRGGLSHIVVNDNGIGIAKKDLPYIFDRLYRADASRARSTGGAGIGLAIVKAIVEAHQGKIQVTSEVGKGTEVIVTIPNK